MNMERKTQGETKERQRNPEQSDSRDCTRQTRDRQGNSERGREGKTETERQEGKKETSHRDRERVEMEKREGKGRNTERQSAIRIRAGESLPARPPTGLRVPASPAQRGVVLIATPAALVALQTLVAGQEAVTTPAPRLRVHTAG